MLFQKFLFLFMVVMISCSQDVGIIPEEVEIIPPVDTLIIPMDTTNMKNDSTNVDTMNTNGNKVRLVKYLALGDSYTIGQSVAESDRFPIQLANRKYGDEDSFKVKIIATTGWTTRNLLDAISREKVEQDTFTFITLLIGVNNQYQGLQFSTYEKEFVSLIDKSISMVGNKPQNVIVVSIPNYGVTPFAASRNSENIRTEIKKYNDYNEKITQQKGSRYVYITDISELAKDDLSLLAGDNLHPSGIMYRLWVDRIDKEVAKILK